MELYDTPLTYACLKHPILSYTYMWVISEGRHNQKAQIIKTVETLNAVDISTVGELEDGLGALVYGLLIKSANDLAEYLTRMLITTGLEMPCGESLLKRVRCTPVEIQYTIMKALLDMPMLTEVLIVVPRKMARWVNINRDILNMTHTQWYDGDDVYVLSLMKDGVGIKALYTHPTPLDGFESFNTYRGNNAIMYSWHNRGLDVDLALHVMLDRFVVNPCKFNTKITIST